MSENEFVLLCLILSLIFFILFVAFLVGVKHESQRRDELVDYFAAREAKRYLEEQRKAKERIRGGMKWK